MPKFIPMTKIAEFLGEEVALQLMPCDVVVKATGQKVKGEGRWVGNITALTSGRVVLCDLYIIPQDAILSIMHNGNIIHRTMQLLSGGRNG